MFKHSLVPRPPPFYFLVCIPCIILNANQRAKNGGGLGTRLVQLQAYTLAATVGHVICLHHSMYCAIPSAHPASLSLYPPHVPLHTLPQSLQACSSGLSASSDETPPQPHSRQWTGQPSCWGAEGSNGGHTQHHLPGTCTSIIRPFLARSPCNKYSMVGRGVKFDSFVLP